MVSFFLRAFNVFRRKLKNLCRNIGDRFLILFQMTYERLKYRCKETKWIWKRVKLTKEQKRAIKKFYKKHYGKKIPYTYHRLFMGFTGKFDEKYIPEMLYAPYLERFLTDMSYGNVFTNKNTLSIFAKGINAKMPENIVICNKGNYFDKDFNNISFSKLEEILHDVGKVFIKITTECCGGRGCGIANFVGGVDLNTNKTIKETLSSFGATFSVQELLVCHESIRKIYPTSVNTFRVITYLLDGKAYTCPIILRLGIGGSFKDNASSGGIFIAVDDDGTMHKSAFTEYRKEYTVHPDTGFVFEGHKIEHLDRVIKEAKRLQYAIPQVGVVNWDFAINDKGEPILVEANMKNEIQAGSIWLPQMAHGKGAFGENTEKILHYIARAKKKSFTKRKNVTL